MSEIVVKSFLGGITDDADNVTKVSFDVLQHFNLNTSTNKLVPNYSLEADEDKTFDIKDFLLANGEFYGFGTGTGGDAGKGQVYDKTSNPLTDSWATATGGTSTAVGNFDGGIGLYKDHIYGVWDDTSVFDYGDITGTPTFTDSFGTLSANPGIISQPIIGKDDEFYFGHDNFLAQINGSATFTEKKLTLPDDYKIVALANWGSYLAIFARGNGVDITSKVFLWNYIDADPSLVIDFGKELLMTGGNVGGTLIGISLTPNDSLHIDQTMVIKTWNGGDFADTLWSKPFGSIGWNILREYYVKDESIFFCVSINDSTSSEKGVWSVGRKNNNFPWRVNQDIKAINDTPTSGSIQGFYLMGDYWWIAHSADGSVDRTKDGTGLFSAATSIVETEWFTNDSPTKSKNLLGVSLSFEPLSATLGGSVVLKYKADEDSSFTTIATEDTDNATVLEALSLDDGNQLPTGWRRLKLRAESSSSAVITGFRAKVENMSSKLD